MGANLNVQLDVAIKYEIPSTANLDSPLYHPLTPASHKRARSDTHESIEKRQRVETEASPGIMRNSIAHDDDLDNILRGVSASITQRYQQRAPSQPGIQTVCREDAIHTLGFTSDPYLSMRILSLPVLDSLVRATFYHKKHFLATYIREFSTNVILMI